MESSNTEKQIKHEKLLSRMAQNDQLAFNEFYEIYYSVLYRYASFNIHDEDTRKDVFH